jgi:hypothetical protein
MPLPKLNLRDLFWIVVVVAMGLGWWADSRQKNSRYKKLESESDARYQFLREQVLDADQPRPWKELVSQACN